MSNLTITDQIERQYTNYDNDELNKKFSGTSIQQPEDSTFSQSREVAMENLKNQYKYYLRRYESAYGQLMVNKSPVLLIDEIDRADEEFEAFLLEILSDYQVSIPELGTINSVTKPIVILTSNGTRDLSDALRRRCLYSYVEYPDRTTEIEILKARQPNIDFLLACQIIDFVQKLRKEDLEKTPGIAEMLDFSAALIGLGVNDLSHDPEILQSAMTTLLKTKTDQWNITTEVAQRIAGQAA